MNINDSSYHLSMHIKAIILAAVSAWATTTSASGQGTFSLDFANAKYTVQTHTVRDKTIRVRAYEHLVYVANPVDTAFQQMNVYVPEDYFEGKTVHGYAIQTAPIFFPNQVGGYMPARPASTRANGFGGPPPNGIPPGQQPPQGRQPNAPAPGNEPRRQNARPNTVLEALARGYVVASAGARGRTSKDAAGTFIGKAPAGIVDLKAAIRYLKYNDKAMPGNAARIISNGTSAGGAMSTLLGATGNHPDYEPYLKALGAASASDDVFGVSAYCPITNLDHADMAYEWQFYGINTYRRGGPSAGNAPAVGTLTAEQIAVSKGLKDLFPAYLNALQLKGNGQLLTLDADGNGSFKTWVTSYLIASAQEALRQGQDLSGQTWISIKDGKVIGLDWTAYVQYLERQKTPPAFDALDLSTGENQLFGTASKDRKHFTDYAIAHSANGATMAPASAVKMMNPLNYIGQPNSKTAGHWRIRHGSKDKDTSLAIPVILGTVLQNKGYRVDLALPWDKPHSGDYDLDELFTWIDQIVK